MPDFREKYATEALRTNFDGVVAPAGGDYVDIQAADDDLDAADYSLLVRTGTYTGFTVSTDDTYVFLGPATVITGAIVLSGDNITLIVGPGSNLQTLVTLSGIGCHLYFLNAVDSVGIVLSGNFGYINGGGWDTLVNGGAAVDAIQITGTDCIVENISVQTTLTGQTIDGISCEAARPTIKKVRVVDADNEGISIAVAATDALIEGCNILGADNDGIDLLGPRARIIGNYMIALGADGVDVGATGDDSTMMGNIIDNATGNPIDIHADGENCVVTGNRTDGATVDNSGTSTVADNDEAAF